MQQITAQDTFTIFIGSGALEYSWYDRINLDGVTELGELEEDTWTLDFIDDATGKSHRVTHDDIMRAVRALAGKAGKDVRHLTRVCRQECQTLLFQGPEDTDFDAASADEVLQYAAFGEIIYG